jgi:hypothetical protein
MAAAAADPSCCWMPSGPLDLTQEQFDKHYAKPLARAAADPDARFVIGSAPRGADAMSLDYLLALGVAPARIQVHLFLPCHEKKAAKLAKRRAEIQAIHNAYAQRGVVVVTHDPAMTRVSHQDILWLRPDEETRTLLGDAYRPDRISGTQANANRRRHQLAVDTRAVGVSDETK